MTTQTYHLKSHQDLGSAMLWCFHRVRDWHARIASAMALALAALLMGLHSVHVSHLVDSASFSLSFSSASRSTGATYSFQEPSHIIVIMLELRRYSSCVLQACW